VTEPISIISAQSFKRIFIDFLTSQPNLFFHCHPTDTSEVKELDNIKQLIEKFGLAKEAGALNGLV